jgi:hypothetical protein
LGIFGNSFLGEIHSMWLPWIIEYPLMQCWWFVINFNVDRMKFHDFEFLDHLLRFHFGAKSYEYLRYWPS